MSGVAYLGLAHLIIRRFEEMRHGVRADQECHTLMRDWHSENLPMLFVTLFQQLVRALRRWLPVGVSSVSAENELARRYLGKLDQTPNERYTFVYWGPLARECVQQQAAHEQRWNDDDR